MLDLDRISSKGGAYAWGGRASDLGRVMDRWIRCCMKTEYRQRSSQFHKFLMILRFERLLFRSNAHSPQSAAISGHRAIDTPGPVSDSELASVAQHPNSVGAESEHIFGISYRCHSDVTLSRKSVTGGCLNIAVFNLHAYERGFHHA